MSLHPAEIAQAAEDLYLAEKSGQQIDLLSRQYKSMDMADAYAVQAALVEKKLARGRHIIGWKIGLTSRAMQDALKIDTPDSGVLLDDMAFATGDTVPKGRFIQPRIEAEIAFVMKSDIAGESISRADVIAATDYVAPSLEILDTRVKRMDPITGEIRTVCDTISDNAANAGIVMGEARHAFEAQDVRWVGAIVQRDNVVEETGLGAGVLNDPVESVVWLARRISQYGQVIRKGDVVLSGSFIRPVKCHSGAYIDADFGDFGCVQISFE